MATALDYTHRTWRENMAGLTGILGKTLAGALSLQAVDLDRVGAGDRQTGFNIRSQELVRGLATTGLAILADVDAAARPVGEAIHRAGLEEVAEAKEYHQAD